MQQSSAEFARLVYTSHKKLSRVVIRNAGLIVEDTYYDGTRLGLNADGTTVTYDRTQDTRTTASVALIQKTNDAEMLVDPAIYPEIEIYSGIMTSTGEEWIKMGTLGVTDRTVSREGDMLTISLNTVDRSAKVRDNPYPAVVQIASGTDYFTGMRTVLNDRAKGFTPLFNHSTSTFTMPDTILAEDADPWADVLAFAQAVQCETFFDREGVHVAMPIPDPLKVGPTIRFNPSEVNILITPVEVSTSNREIFNGVICKGEAPWLLFPIRGEIWDMDPLSPTYRPTFGDKPKKIGDAIASTDAQCLATATAEFNKVRGVVENISFGMINDPRLDVGDILDTVDDRLDITGRYVLDSYTFNMGTQTATGTTRRRR